MSLQEPIRTLLFSTLYPSSVRPGHGIFVEARLRELLSSGKVQTKVVAPVPWFFSKDPRFGSYARLAQTPLMETHNDIDVRHPRYFLPPKVGMTVAPFALALGAIPAIRGLLAQGFDFDLIDAHYYYPDGVAAAMLARHFRRPFTVTARGSDVNLIATHAIPRKLMLWAADKAAASIGVSRALVDKLAQMGVDRSKLEVMRNGVDLERFQMLDQRESREALGWPQQPTLISVGNLVRNKGHHIAIEALRELAEFRLVIVGDGPEQTILADLARQWGLDARVTFSGRVMQQDLALYYSGADILVLPSSREGWPNVLLEAMACGTPVVASNVGGVAEMVTSSDAGRLLPELTSHALASMVLDLWSQHPPRDSVRRHAQAFDWQSTTDAQTLLFQHIKANPVGASDA
jgi:teichuronic acid biosynthesis glycosyltransferase TuaC